MQRLFRLTSILQIVFLFVPLVAVGQVSVIGELSQDRDARPGDRYEGTITVRNDTDVPQDAKVYQTDYLFRFDGTNDYGTPPPSHSRSNAEWVTFNPSFLTIPPQATMTINYTVNVPVGNPLVGTYWSMLMVEGVPKTSPESSSPQKKDEMGIMQTIRYGIQVATTIAQTGQKKVNFIDAKLVTPERGKRVLQIDIENTGELGMRPEVYVELFDQQGVSRGKYPGTRYRMYPGTSVRQSIDLSVVKAGTYKALVVVDAGGEDIFGAQYTLQF
ncbi:MAG: hypothetical protein L0Y80_02150 [Ignavibacteriae bacterium]|nr:hypothetical protein [Ignavibacteriota bacterium]